MKRLFLILLVVAAVGVAYLLLSLDARVARAIEDSVSRSLGAEASVAGVDLTLTEGRGTIRGLTVANPEGFSDADLFRFDEIDLRIDAASVGEQPFRVTAVRIGESTVRFEVTESGDSNIEHVVHHLSAHKPKDDETQSGGEPQRVAIEALRFDGGEILVWREGDDEPETVKLPPLEMSDLGGEDGATGGELSREIARVFTRRVVAATAGHELGRAVGKELGDTAGEVAESILRNILD